MADAVWGGLGAAEGNRRRKDKDRTWSTDDRKSESESQTNNDKGEKKQGATFQKELFFPKSIGHKTHRSFFSPPVFIVLISSQLQHPHPLRLHISISTQPPLPLYTQTQWSETQ